MADNEIEIRVKGRNDANLDKLGAQGRAAGKEIATGLERGFREGEQAGERARRKIGADLDKTAADAKDAGQEAGSSFGDSMQEGLSDAMSGGGIGDALGGMLENLKGAGGPVAAAGIGIGTVLIGAISGAIQQEDFGRLLAAQMGGTRADAKRYGEMAGQVYADGFGESLEEVREGLTAVLGAGIAESEADVERVTSRALTVSKVVGASAQEVADAARSMLKAGLVSSADEAFDLIVTGFQRGADAGHDMIDVLTDSSVNLHRFGLDGAAAVGVMKQALDAGAPSADAFTGSLEELVGNAADGIPVFKELGLGGADFAAKLAGGGPQAAKALDQLLDGIRKIEDPARRSAVVVSLFGEEATALQDAILAVDPSEAAAAMDDFSGATQRAGETAASTTRPLENFWRGLKEGALDAGDHMIRGADNALAFGDAVARGFQPEKIEGTAVAAREFTMVQEEATRRQKTLTDAREAERDALDRLAGSLGDVISEQQKQTEMMIGQFEASMDYQEAIDTAAESIREHGRTTNEDTEAGRENKRALLDVADAAWGQVASMEAQGKTAQEVQGFLLSARARFVEMATGMGMSKAEAEGLANQLRLIPGEYDAIIRVQGLQAALNGVASLQSSIRNIVSFGGMFAHGGVVGSAASGGPRGNLTMVGEHGPELVNLAPGSTVRSNPDTMRALGGSGGGAREWSEVRMTFDGNLDSMMATAWMKAQELGMIRVAVR